MNSASYYYTGKGFGSDGSRATISNPLFSFITVSSNGNIIKEGRKGAFKEPTPLDLGHPDALRLSASIRDRVIAKGR